MKCAILILLAGWSHAKTVFRFPVVGDWGGKDGTPYSTIAQRMEKTTLILIISFGFS